MSDLDALLSGIVADPANELRWLVLADWLDDHDQHDRAELLRLHRELLRTCVEPDAHPERPEWHARIMELMRSGVRPCVPQHTLTLPGGVELTASFIPPGSFLMGSPETETMRTRAEQLHRVTLTKGFFLGIHPVTHEQWRAVMSDNQSHRTGDSHPMGSVSWVAAQALCAAVKERTGQVVRLPTEAEWEYACRAGTSTPFYWGSELNGTQANCVGSFPYGTKTKGPTAEGTTTVGKYATEFPHPWGLADVHGNVWEWCHDWYGGPTEVAEVDPQGAESGTQRVYRGGSWGGNAAHCRAAFRRRSSPDNHNLFHGFRVVVVPPDQM